MGLAEVSGFYTNLKKGFDHIGVEAELVTLVPHRFGYGDSHTAIWIKMAQFAVKGRGASASAALPLRFFWVLLALVTRVMLLTWAIIRFDVFLFCCSTSFFRFRELRLLKLFGKRIIYNFHGTDGRCAFMDGFAEDIFLPVHMREGTGYIGPVRDGDSEEVRAAKFAAYAALTAWRKENIRHIEKYADVLINSPSHGQHHERPFVQRLIIGMPYLPERELIARYAAREPANVVTILHSPSYPEGKGSPGIRAAIKALIEKGLPINYVEVTGRPNREVLELIGQCDFVIDQLYSDMGMVGFATEAAFFGKPAIVGGYYADLQAKEIAPEWLPPTEFCMPDDIEASIEKLVVDTDYRRRLGEKAREFVENRWLADRSAERVAALARGDFPDEWLFDPYDATYVLGMGMSKNDVCRVMKGMYEGFGIQAFHLDDKEKLRSHILEYVRE
jgi:glycosyltransferase involved in cell wall biosynthesis